MTRHYLPAPGLLVVDVWFPVWRSSSIWKNVKPGLSVQEDASKKKAHEVPSHISFAAMIVLLETPVFLGMSPFSKATIKT
jgi:hypothetical protein